MANQDASQLPNGDPGDLSLDSTGLIASNDSNAIVEFTPREVLALDTDPVKASYNLNAAEGGAIGVHHFAKKESSIPNNSAHAVLTVTVPNAEHTAVIRGILIAICGIGGAVGANEAMAVLEVEIRLTRTAGVATGFGVTTRETSQTQNVTGATTLSTFSAAVSSISGANSATQTFTLNVTIARNSGSADNHKCLMDLILINENASGVTIA